MKYTKAESRYNNIAKKMDKAFISLLLEKDFQEISVSELCLRAGVNRSTFYNHFKNTHEMLLALQTKYTKKLYDLYNKADILKIDEIDKSSKEDIIFITPKYIIPYLEFTKENLDFFNIYIKNIRILNNDRIIDKYVKNLFIDIFAKFNITDERIIKYQVNFYFVGIHAIITQWVKNGCPDSVEFVCNVIIDVIMRGVDIDNI